MREIDRTKDLKRFYLDWQALNHVYEQYARDNGLTYVSLFMLQLRSVYKELHADRETGC